MTSNINENGLLYPLEYLELNDDSPRMNQTNPEISNISENNHKISTKNESNKENKQENDNKDLDSLDDLIHININVNKDENQKNIYSRKDSNDESSCCAEYYESCVGGISLVESDDMSQEKNNQEYNKIGNLCKKNKNISYNYNSMELLKRKTKNKSTDQHYY